MSQFACALNDIYWGQASVSNPPVKPEPILYPSSAPEEVTNPTTTTATNKWFTIRIDTAIYMLYILFFFTILFMFHLNNKISSMNTMMHMFFQRTKQ